MDGCGGGGGETDGGMDTAAVPAVLPESEGGMEAASMVTAAAAATEGGMGLQIFLFLGPSGFGFMEWNMYACHKPQTPTSTLKSRQYPPQ